MLSSSFTGDVMTLTCDPGYGPIYADLFTCYDDPSLNSGGYSWYPAPKLHHLSGNTRHQSLSAGRRLP